MSRGINKVILIGNLGGNPEVRYTPNGSAVAIISIATSDTWKDKQSGEMQDRTEWHRVVFFNRLAEIVGEYLHKGSKVYIEGALRSRKWQDKNGIERYVTEIVANDMCMLDGKVNEKSNTDQSSVTSSTVNKNIDQNDNSVSFDDHVLVNEDDDIPF